MLGCGHVTDGERRPRERFAAFNNVLSGVMGAGFWAYSRHSDFKPPLINTMHTYLGHIYVDYSLSSSYLG